MNEEEREAINRIKKLYSISLDINKTPVVLTEDTRCLGILLNLIDNQQKELENSISKDKIREKMEEKEREIQEFIGTDNTGRFTRDNCRITDEVNVLKELLKGSD